MSTKRKTYSSAFKAKVALEAIREQETINQIASRYEILPVQVSQWKALLLKSSSEIFDSPRKKNKDGDWEVKEARFHQKIGQLEMERDWLKKKSEQLGILPRS